MSGQNAMLVVSLVSLVLSIAVTISVRRTLAKL